ncbi:MAG TPA: tRNA dihydrouridine(20/20a) synthase DusA [Gammaproteobacteria bacterium]
MTEIDRRFCIAPMMDWTDRHCRYLLRLIFAKGLLYTEMVTASAVRHGNREKLLSFNAFERPLALQLGGSDPDDMAFAAEQGQRFGYDEVNINVGCPSDRVQAGMFGACLMAAPATVAAAVTAMKSAVHIPVTVKTRIGVDQQDDYEFLHRFVATVAAAGCEVFIIHARKALLQGLSPKENREIPPLQYERVYRLKEDFPELKIVLNGGINSTGDVALHLNKVDGVMVGRRAYQDPYALADVGRLIFSEQHFPSREEVVRDYMLYIEEQLSRGVALKHMTRHMSGLYQGLSGARAWRRILSEDACKPKAGLEVIQMALEQMTSRRQQVDYGT